MAKVSYPLQHLSIRVPWHDNRWNGTVCKNPKLNTACLKLKGISDKKNTDKEEPWGGWLVSDILDIDEEKSLPPCVRERATFMCPTDFAIKVPHPYAYKGSTSHAHFRDTALRFPAYSAPGLPFHWMMRDEVFGSTKKKIRGKLDKYPLDGLNEEFEPDLGYGETWLQDHRNQRASLECFWNHVKPQESLVFFYAKQVPLVDDTGRRILIGVGRVKAIGELTNYRYTLKSGDFLKSILWERMVTHTIRPDSQDGFLLPYHKALEESGDGRNFDPADVLAYAPDERLHEFSYATEHVGNDAAIGALLSIRDSLHKCSELFDYDNESQLLWIDSELGKLWEKRGPFPGMGAVLSATGIKMGNFIAQHIAENAGPDNDPWAIWLEAVREPETQLPDQLAGYIDETIARSWELMEPDRLEFLKLLSRMDVSQEQARAMATPEGRKESGLSFQEEEVLDNLYVVYETSRLTSNSVSLEIVDRAVFPSPSIQKNFPFPERSRFKTPVDKRRLRALTIQNLEFAASNRGDTVRLRGDVILELKETSERNEIIADITGDLMKVAERDHFKGEVCMAPLGDGQQGYQLERLAAAGRTIKNLVEKRLKSGPNVVQVDWRKALDRFLLENKQRYPKDPDERKEEEAARTEKAAALDTLASSRFSVLVGQAGTGKTTLLSVLCAAPEINQDMVLLLAPTGKARVRMEDVARKAGIQNFSAHTIAQHLHPDRYDSTTHRYRMLGKKGEASYGTVIVDESSMLTEEMMAALFESFLKVNRVILVGDHRQLPPIGAGRPFVDIVARLNPNDGIPHKCFAELKIPRRQGASDRDDLLLASWFGGGELAAGEDQVFEIISGKRKSDTVDVVTWNSLEELEDVLPKTLAETLKFSFDLDENQSFGRSLGGNLGRQWIWHEHKHDKRPGSGKFAEAWQILSPVRQRPWGADGINRFIHERYKEFELTQSRKPRSERRIAKPMGEHQVVYGDKVINVRNQKLETWRINPNPSEPGYLANGEIGIVCGPFRQDGDNRAPERIEVEFSTQLGDRISFSRKELGEEGSSTLELAYALTVHKAQGSEFGTVFLVLPRSLKMVKRELLYTALTRQRDKIVLLVEGAANELHRLSSSLYSDTASRLTNLFSPPNRVQVEIPGEEKPVFLEERLIHRTESNELVRSKSEVIIHNMLSSKGLQPRYEIELVLGGTPQNKFPDFTIVDHDLKESFYWEHLGMLTVPSYKRRWENKKKWYRDHGILPLEESGGPKGTLITTQDEPNGAIDSAKISRLIEEVFGV